MKSEKIEKAIQQLLDEAGARVVAAIQSRVSRGEGLDDSPMKEYTPQYKKIKEASGRRSDIRDLTWSGRMLTSLHFKRGQPFSGVVSFSDARSQQLAKINQEIEPWFGLSPADEEQIREFLDQKLKELQEL